MNLNQLLLILAISGLLFGTFHIIQKKMKSRTETPPPAFEQPHQQPEPEKKPQTPKITTVIPEFLNNAKLPGQLDTWAKEAPELTKRGNIGKSTKGVDIQYIKVSNFYKKNLPKILITGCIHGNEPHSTTTIMAYIGTLLNGYGTDAAITELLDTREICFIPVLSPDSYPNSRQVDGVDPNRDFKNERSKPIQLVKKFFQSEGFCAAISGHTWGRVFLTPHGDSQQLCSNHESIMGVMKEMSKLSGYQVMRACELYKGNGGVNVDPIRFGTSDWDIQEAMQPIYGTDVDFYYRTGDGQRPAFALVCEFGTHQRVPTLAETNFEFKKTWPAFAYFCKHAPLAQQTWQQP